VQCQLTMKSMAMDVKGRVKLSEGMGKGGSLGFVGLFLCDWQRWHPLTYSEIVCFMLGHQ
jgi:hypothetical protein